MMNHRTILGGGIGLVMLCMAALCAALGSAEGAVPVPGGKSRDWWSLQPVVRPPLPEGDAANPIDRFLNAELHRENLRPAGRAEKRVLLRRVYLDLIGLPPTPQQQQDFLADASPDAYERVVDQLLRDEQHGVRYARHWLDVLRYADSDERMPAAAGIHLWREWVIHALNADLPYDQFVQVQLTGRRSSERTQMSATGYRTKREPRPGDLFALGLLARGAGGDPQDLAISAVETISTAFLGMTVGCAKCHDHMYDPISQQDFYAMKALFDPLVLRKVTLASAAELMAAGRAMAEVERKRAPAQRALEKFIAPFKARLYEERVLMLPPDVQRAVRKAERERSVEEQKMADDYFPILRIDGDKITEIMTPAERERRKSLQAALDAAGGGDDPGRREGMNIPVFHTVEVDRVREQEQFYFLNSGDPARPQKQHPSKPGWPFSESLPDCRDGRIEAFVDWLTAPENPLFARVAVNRLWQWHFGRGLHKLSSDFGLLGGRPIHQPLLDWLAAEFTRQNYSMKAMHRLIVTSEAYQRMSEVPADLYLTNAKKDADNERLWCFPLRRLDAEAIWDSIHQAAGGLDLKVGGRSFDVSRAGAVNKEGGGTLSRTRRGVYLTRGYSASRDVTSHFLQSFDVDDGREPCPMRTRTVTAPQALFLMNSSEVDSAVAGLAEAAWSEARDDVNRALDAMYQRTLARPPTQAEREQASEYVRNTPARLKDFAWVLFNLDEFIYVR